MGIEKRKFKRYKPDQQFVCGFIKKTSADQSSTGVAQVVDLNATGACVIVKSTPAPLAEGNRISVLLQSDQKKGFLSRVAWVKEPLIGLHFDYPKAVEQQMNGFLSHVSSEFEKNGTKSEHAQYICPHCVLNSKIPGLSFDSDGVCEVCRNYRKQEHSPKNYEQLEIKLAQDLKAGSKKNSYDCLCFVSGGDDSAYMLTYLVKQCKLKVLAFTVDQHFMTSAQIENLRQLFLKLDVDHVLFKPAWNLNKEVLRTGILYSHHLRASQKTALTLGHVGWPSLAITLLFGMKFASDKNIPNLVIDKSSFGSLKEAYKTLIDPLLDLLTATGQQALREDLEMFFWQHRKALRAKLIAFYDYVRYDSREISETMNFLFGWTGLGKRPGDPGNALLNDLNKRIHWDKYAFRPGILSLAQDVREGLVDRQEALMTLINEPDLKVTKSVADALEIEISQ